MDGALAAGGARIPVARTAPVGAAETLRRMKAPAALVLLDAPPVLAAANAAFVEAVGVGMAGLAGRHPLSWAEPQSAERALRDFDAAARLRGEWSGPLLSAAAPGGARVFSALLLPLFGDGGEALCALLRLAPADRDGPGGAVPRARAAARARDGGARDGGARGRSVRDGHARAIKALRLLSAMAVLEEPCVRDRRGRAALARLRERAGSLAHVLDVLSRSGDPPETRLRDQIARLCDEIGNCRAGGMNPSAVEFSVSADPLPWGPERLVTLMLIVHELVGNALRHAFPPGARGSVAVRLRRVDDIVRLHVEDDGMGLAPDAFVKDCFGIGMVEAMVRREGGTLAFGGGRGTAAMVRLPLS